jgi:cytochrome c
VNKTAVGLLVIVACLANVWGVTTAQDQPTKPSQVMAHGFDCFSCHAIDRQVVGPAWVTIANHYHHDPAKTDYLAGKILHGSVGTFGDVPMPAHKKMSPELAKKLAAYILGLKGKVQKGPVKEYEYKSITGKTVRVHFPVFVSWKGKNVVTDSIFGGFEKYNSYCFRCHGFDAVGGEYAPDLRRSLNNGMTKRRFFTVAMEGNEAKGMPGWNGFFNADEMNQIYEYVKARADDLIGPGRPPSKGD